MRTPTPPENPSQFLVCDTIIDCNFYGYRSYLAPLYLYEEPDKPDMLDTGMVKRPNFKKGFVEFIEKKYGKRVSSSVGEGLCALPSVEKREHTQVLPYETITPEQIFGYIYAILYCPTYREKYLELLKIDFPRVPFVEDEALFFRLSELGWELAQHHLMRETYEFISNYPVAGTDEVEKVEMTEETLRPSATSLDKGGNCASPLHKGGQGGSVPLNKGDVAERQGVSYVRVWINEKQYFDNVPREVWDFYIGGYQVLDKWLKSRKNRTLTNDDITATQNAKIDELAGGEV